MQTSSFDLHATAGTLAGAIAVIALIPYVLSMLRGETKPSLVSWWIWTVVGLMLAGSYQASGAGHTWWVALAYVVNPLVVAILAFRYGTRTSDALDWICLAGALASLIPWFLLQSPALAHYLVVLVDCLGAVPTIRKSLADPAGENKLSWSLALLAAVINIVAIDRWVPEIFVFPIYAVIVNAIIVGALMRRRVVHAA